MSHSPWLSVVMPVYNGERYLAAALTSLLDQVGRAAEAVEILVSDDGSTDRSAAITETFIAAGPVVALSGPRLRNWVANSNYAARRASGRFMTFLHQDDIWLPGRLDAIRRVTECRMDLSLWVSSCRFIGPSGRDVGAWRLPFGSANSTVDPHRFQEHLLVQNFIGMPAPLFSKAAFDAVGGMDESLWYTADWDLWLKLGSLGPVEVTADATAAFRIHTESQTVRGTSAFEIMRSQTEIVRLRHLPGIVDPNRRDEINRAGQLSTELNAAMAALVGHQSPRWRELGRSLIHAGFDGCKRFARDARFLERSLARVRAGLASE